MSYIRELVPAYEKKIISVKHDKCRIEIMFADFAAVITAHSKRDADCCLEFRDDTSIIYGNVLDNVVWSWLINDGCDELGNEYLIDEYTIHTTDKYGNHVPLSFLQKSLWKENGSDSETETYLNFSIRYYNIHHSKEETGF